MAIFVVGLMFLISMAGHSDATYCVCNTGLSDTVLQRDIDYACGNGADCSAILQNGACFNPNTVRDHCNYAVNSYYQRRGQVTGSCDFSGTASVSQTAPSSVASGCVYQANPSTGGTTNPSIAPPTGGTTNPSIAPPTGGTTNPSIAPPAGGTPNTGGSTNPGTGTGTGTGIGTGVPGSTFPGGSTMTPGAGVGLGPTGSGFTDDSAKMTLSLGNTIGLMSLTVTLLLSGLMLPRI